jgi:putative nucleotidyltransferase with HDIG domain
MKYQPTRYTAFLLFSLTILNALIIGVIFAVISVGDFGRFGATVVILLGSLIISVIVASSVMTGLPILKDVLKTYQGLFRLGHINHPLLLRLQKEAPGTFHHSLATANLAYQAARKINADAALARIGAYYHDIGKIKNPAHYIENQEGYNPHDHLTPKESAAIIIRHIVDGISLARQYRLPNHIIDFIPEHTGTTLVRFFYEQAKRENPNIEIEKRNFCYPGPKPMSRETAIVMLADSVEAAMRANPKAKSDRIQKVIEEIVAQKEAEQQLDISGLTKRDITRIKQAFKEEIIKMNHKRIKYPKPCHAKPRTSK